MGRYVAIPNEIFDQYGAEIGCGGLAVYGLLLKYADASTGECFPSLETIGKVFGISKPTALKYVERLEECGLVEKLNRRTKIGTQESNLYRVKIFNPEPAAGSDPCLDRVKNFNEPSKEFCESRVKNFDCNYPQRELTPEVPPPPPAGMPGQDFEDGQRFLNQHLGVLEDAVGTIGGATKTQLIEIFASYFRRGKPPTLAHLKFAVNDAREYSHTTGTVSTARLITGLAKAIDPRPKAQANGSQHHPANRPRPGAAAHGRNGRADPLAGITDEQRAAELRRHEEFIDSISH